MVALARKMFAEGIRYALEFEPHADPQGKLDQMACDVQLGK